MLAALVIAGCGGASSGAPERSPEPQRHARSSISDASFEHVHGLGINPRDGALFIATHTGLFRAGKGEPAAVRVGTSEQDVMGFTIVGPDRFLGSGHPDPRQPGQPPNLGLISSPNGGHGWATVSLRGQADFHVLRSLGPRVLGFNGLTGKLMVSADSGRHWQERTPPGPLIDLAIDPGKQRRLIAATDQGLAGSSDDGRSWQPLRQDAIGLLVWPSTKQLFWIDADGSVHRSTNGGRNWQDHIGSIGGQPTAFMAHHSELYAALADGTVKRSTDGGARWTVRAKP